MPTRLLPVEHSLQEVGAGCLAACAKMVLHYMGIEQSQRSLNQMLGLSSLGVPYTNLTRLTRLGIHIAIHVGNETQIEQAIDQNLPIIAFLLTGDLHYWQDNTPHAVVIVGYDEKDFYVNDPSFTIAPQRVQRDEFLLAWGEMDYAYAAMRK